MTVNRKKAQQKTAVSFIVTASTRDEATQSYLALSSGEDAQNRIALADPENNVVVSMSSSEIGYNPLTGEPNLVDVELDNEELALHSVSSSDDKVQAFYAVCSDGCGQHILTSEENIYFCPSCSTALPAADDELDFHAESSDLDDLEHVGHVDLEPVNIGSDYVVAVAAATPEEAFEQFIDASNGTDAEVYSDGGNVTYITSESSAMAFAIDGSEVAHVGRAMPGEEEFTSKSSDLNANIMQCSACSMFSVSSSQDMHNCIKCGGELVEPNEEDVKHVSQSSDDDLEEDLGSDEDEEDFDLELEEDEDSEEEEEEDDMSSISSSLRADLASLSGDDEEEEEEEEEEDDEDFDLEEEEEEDGDDDIEGLDLDSDDEDSDDEEEEEEEDMTSESSSVTELDVNMLTALASNEPNGELNPALISVAHCGTVQNEPTWVAFYGKYPVATATASTVKPQHVEMLNKPTFATAVLAAIAADGVEEGLKDFGFEAVSPDIQMEAVVDRQLMLQAESRVSEVREAFEAERLEYSNRFLAALATASLGINRQVFRGVENPTARYLVASLSAAGVRNAEELVNDAFVQTADMYNKTLIAKASDLVSGSVESQNSVAEMVASASAKPLVRTGAPVTVEQQQLTSQSSANKQPTTAKPGRYSSLING